MMILFSASAAPIASISGYTLALPPSIIERPPILMTWQSASMRTTGVSVEDMTCLSSRLSRISNDRTWWRRSVAGCCELSMSSYSPSRHSRGDDGPHRLSIERSSEVARDQPVDDLNRAPVLSVFHHLENAALNDHVVQIQCFKLLHRNVRDELGRGVFLGIRGVQPVLILD